MEKSKNLDALTGLKGIFIFVIVFYHTLPLTPFMDKIPLTSFIHIYGGTLGNYVFFMISGFLICWNYRSRIQQGDISFPLFMKRRLQKLYPIYILSNAAMLLSDLIEYGLCAINLKNIALTVLLQNGGGLETAHPFNGPTWFVSALFVCYMAYYFVAYISKNRTQYFCLLAFGIIWGYSIVVGEWQPPIYFGRNGESFMNFFIGCTIAEVYPYIRDRQHKILRPAALASLVLSVALLLTYGVEVISGNSRVGFAFVICPLTLYLTLESKLFSGFLKSKPIMWLGKISISVYFWHYVIYVYFHAVWKLCSGGAPITDISYAGYLVIMIVLSVLSNRWLMSSGKKPQKITQ